MNMFKAKVFVTLKKGVLDPQGAAIERACKSNGYSQISQIFVGKMIEFTVNENDKEKATEVATLLAEKILTNPIMEDCHVVLEEKV